MRHGKKINHLGRTASHRKAMLSNMAASLILHKRISTTLAKAKELKKFVEPLVTRAKEDTTHNRRIAFSYLKSKEAIKALFGENAEMCIIELVDFNELMLKDAAPAKKTTRRSRRSSGEATSTPAPAAPKAAKVEAAPAPVVDEVEEAPVAEAEVVEETAAPVAEAASEETPAAEASEEGETEEK
jgi:large subunit ribosomal protein L17